MVSSDVENCLRHRDLDPKVAFFCPEKVLGSHRQSFEFDTSVLANVGQFLAIFSQEKFTEQALTHLGRLFFYSVLDKSDFILNHSILTELNKKKLYPGK